MQHSRYNFNDTLPDFPFDAKVTDQTVKEARSLHVAARAAQEQLGVIGVELREAQLALQNAHADLEAQRVAPLRDEQAELDLADEIRRRQILADQQAFQRRFDAAAEEAHRCTIAYRHCVKVNGPALLALVEPDAVAATEKLAAALANIEPLRTARRAQAARVTAITQCFHNGSVDDTHRWALPGDELEAPVPADWAVAALARQLSPEPVEPVVLAASDGTWYF